MADSSTASGADGDQVARPNPEVTNSARGTFELPIVTTSLSRRQIREREGAFAASVAASSTPAGETRRERRERELAKALSAPAAGSLTAPTGRAPQSAPERVVSKSLFAQQVTAMAAATPVAPPAPAVSPEPVVVTAPVVATAQVVEPAEREVPVEVEPALVVPLAPELPVVAEPALVAHLDSEPFTRFDDEPVTDQISVIAVPSLNEAPAYTSVQSLTFDRIPGVTEPRAASSAVAAPGRRRVLPVRRRRAASTHPQAPKRTIFNTVVMIATAGLVATFALPAYAYSDLGPLTTSNAASSQMGIQSLSVPAGTIQDAPRDGYTSTGDIASMDSTTGNTVSPTVQALAAELMGDVASGKLVGSVPNHIPEIQNLANGVVVPNCGVDYRVLQAIKVAVDNFSKVGISDINRKCTGQIEGAGTASAHYTDGGGHAVDFYILNGHGLTGADSDSLKLIALLDPLVPPGSGLGQAECRGSTSVTNFAPFDDTCTHDHIDFLNAKGVALKSS
ncbi:hypothetical protein [Subtercola lobariae]|uniref:Uncharacterized protein n=1 Tax=Subtercola lobariae TaxID=1588641 RepID=A0A917EZ36_9MICO|nr:hypothetical protein [Subtercola lobariae]GGF34025.1 hypothetical protein GCM10011399_29000 [Subtercola lobariae]